MLRKPTVKASSDVVPQFPGLPDIPELPEFPKMPEFNIQDPPPVVKATFKAYDACEVHTLSHAADYRDLHAEIVEQLRKWLKYGHTFKRADEALEAMQTFCYEERQERLMREEC